MAGLEPVPVTTSATTPSTDSLLRHRPSDYLVVTIGWAVAVVAAAVFPLDHPQVERVALFVHLMSMAVGFGAVVMIDVYGLLWMFGHRALSELTALAAAAHGVIAIGVGGLLASGIALRPDVSSPLAQLKLFLVLLLMLNGAGAQRMLARLKLTMPSETRGASIPWSVFQRGLAAALISQATWWGAIAIGFVNATAKH
jgi:hypothetical protein